MTIRAKTTVAFDYRFRSRLEARYAVFFQSMGLVWEYEKEGYDLPSGPYLPDFWLNDFRVWAEVKPVEFTEKERSKAVELQRYTKFPVVALVGVPEFKPYHVFGVRKRCYVGPIFMRDGYSNLWPEDQPLSDKDKARLMDAVAEAKAARFEFGESPDIQSRPILVDPGDMPDVSAGMMVEHKTFGQGLVITTRDNGDDLDLIIKFARDRNPRCLSRNSSVGRGLLKIP